jgi:SAM-dependent methyltransferase
VPTLREHWDRRIYPYLLECACGTSAIMAERARWIARVQGEVLEVGIGSGLNLPLLDAQRVASFVGLDPSGSLLARAAARTTHVPTTLISGTAEALPFDAARFDTVLMTFTLCSVDDPGRALAEIRRVLRPGGALVFIEHGASKVPRWRRWQRRLTPVWRVVSGNCHLDRDVPALIERAGLTIAEIDDRDADASFLSHAYSGIARRAS